MRKIIFILSLLLSFAQSYGQTGVTATKYYITGSLALGKQNGGQFADTSLWVEVGKDTTNKGLGMPKVILSSYATVKKGVVVYNIADSGLYQVDGSKKRRLLTLSDTVLIKALIAIYGGGGGTVSSVSATDGTEIDFTVTNPTTTPDISYSINAASIANSKLANSSITFNIGTSGTAPAFSVASPALGGFTTLNIPAASASSVTAGTISKTEHDNFLSGYNDKIVSALFTGSRTKLLTLTQQDGGTVTASTTIDTAYYADTSAYADTAKFALNANGGTVTSVSATDGTEIDFTVTNPTTTPNISYSINAGSIANAKLANSTISGIALGNNLAALTIGTGLSGTSYNGSGAVTINTAGAYTANGFTMATNRLLGRSTASTGAAEEITPNTGLQLASGNLNVNNVPNAALQNSTISGVSLGGNLFSLTPGTGITGSAYNGSAAFTWDLTDPIPSQTGNSGKVLSTNGTVLSWIAASGSGTVTDFTAGNLSPLFTTSVGTSTTTPDLTFSLSNAAAHTFFGNNTGSTGAPAYVAIGVSDLPSLASLYALTGAITSSGLTIGSGKLAGRSTAATGAIEEITPNTGLALSSGNLNVSNVPNASLANSTISGVALGGNLFSLTPGSGISGSAYNGSGALTWNLTDPIPSQTGHSGEFLTTNGTALSWGAPAGSGTVTSVGLTVPSWLSVAGSPVTSSGTLAVTATSGLTANQFLGTPSGSTGAVSLRSIVLDDLPTITVPGGGTGNTSATAYALQAGGTTSTGAFQSVGTGSAGQILRSGGNAALPAFSTATYPNTAGTAANMLMSDGTNFVSTAIGGPNSTTSSGNAQNVATSETQLGADLVITPSSTGAKIRIQGYVSMTKDAGTTVRSIALRIKNVTGAATQIGKDITYTSANVAANPFGGTVAAIDAPGSTSAQTYRVYGQMNGAACSTATYYLFVEELTPAGAASTVPGPAQGISVNSQSGTTYTLVSGDNGKIIEFTNGSAVTVTLPSGLGTTFGCTIYQAGAGQVTISASGTTIRNRQSLTKTAGQYASFSVLPTSTTNTYFTQGDMN